MAIYRLEPATFDDTKWKDSSVAETIWVAASTPARARRTAAEKTAVGMQSHAEKVRSPWLLDALTTCVLENRAMGVPLGTVMIADGRIVSPDGVSG